MMVDCFKCQKATNSGTSFRTYDGCTLCWNCSQAIACDRVQDADPIKELENKATKAYYGLTVGLGASGGESEEEDLALEVEALEELAAALLALAAAKKR